MTKKEQVDDLLFLVLYSELKLLSYDLILESTLDILVALN